MPSSPPSDPWAISSVPPRYRDLDVAELALDFIETDLHPAEPTLDPIETDLDPIETDLDPIEALMGAGDPLREHSQVPTESVGDDVEMPSDLLRRDLIHHLPVVASLAHYRERESTLHANHLPDECDHLD